MPRDIRLDGLNREQVELLDIMWSMDSTEDFLEWKYTLNRHLQREVDVLVQLLGLEIMEQQLEAMNGHYPDAEEILKKIAKKS